MRSPEQNNYLFCHLFLYFAYHFFKHCMYLEILFSTYLLSILMIQVVIFLVIRDTQKKLENRRLT